METVSTVFPELKWVWSLDILHAADFVPPFVVHFVPVRFDKVRDIMWSSQLCGVQLKEARKMGLFWVSNST